MHDAILTTAVGYDFNNLRLFLNSLNTCFDGDLIVFGDRTLKLGKFNFKIVTIDYKIELSKCEPPALNTSNNYRYFLYLNFLKENKYKRILLTDCRDVFFQSNPLKNISENFLYTAIENNTIGNCGFNSKWIESTYGYNYLKEVSSDKIICSGTTMGAYNEIMNYLNHMVSDIKKFGTSLDTGDNKFVLDQAVHNFFCKKFNYDIIKSTNEDNIFFTAGYANLFHVDKKGYLANEKGDKYSLVHQYDRFEWLCHHLAYLSLSDKKSISSKSYLTKIKNLVLKNNLII